MDASCMSHNPALAAGQILAAMESGNPVALERELMTAEQLAHTEASTAHTVEQLDLLEAVTSQMRGSIRRFERRLVSHVEGMEVSMQLLRHLANGRPRQPGTSFTS